MQSKMTQRRKIMKEQKTVGWWLLGAEEHGGEMNSERVQTSSYKMSKYWIFKYVLKDQTGIELDEH